MTSALDKWDSAVVPEQSALEKWDAAPAVKPAANDYQKGDLTGEELDRMDKAAADKPGKVMSALAGAGEATGRTAMAVQQIIGKGMTKIGDMIGDEKSLSDLIAPRKGNILQEAGNWLQADAVAGAKKLAAENAPYREANPVSNVAGQIVGIVANPVNKVFRGWKAATTLVWAVAKGAAQGAALNTLTTPVTDGNFLWEKIKQAGLGAVGGATGATIGYGLGKAFDKAVDLFRRAGTRVAAGDASVAAENIVNQTLGKLADAVKADRPELFNGLKTQVEDAIKAGTKVDPKALTRLAQAQTLPVPVPMLKGQVTRDPMQFAKELNLRGIQGVGEPIQATLREQNKALVANLDALGAKDASDVVTAGKTAIDALKSADKSVSGKVSAAYKAFRDSTGKDLDVPLKGMAQDYAATLKEFGDAIPGAIRSKFEGLGLTSGTAKKVFSIEDAEGLIKSINRNYDPANRVQARALDELRKSVQKAISEGAGEGSGGEASALAKAAREAARTRFDLIEKTPGLKAALSGEQPDKFIQRFILQGNVGEIRSMMDTLAKADPQAAAEVQNAVMGFIKGRVTGLNDQGAFSQAQLKQFVSNPNMAARLTEVLGKDKMGLLRQLNAVAENALYEPVGAAVNRSNTASAAANLVKSEIEGGGLNKLYDLMRATKIPLVEPAGRALQGSHQSGRAAGMISEAVNPSLRQSGATSASAVAKFPPVAGRAGVAALEERRRREARR